MSDVVWTIANVLKSSIEFLTKKGIPNPRFDAELMLAKCLGFKRINLYLEYDRPLTVNERNDFKALLFRRGCHEPAAYILEEVGFMGYMFKVSKDTLIPRPDTELLIEEALKLLPSAEPSKILDIGTGSGCVGISLLKLRQDLEVETWDISEKALGIARENALNLGVLERYTPVLKSALLEDSYQGKFDGIVSNPPYISVKDFESLDATVKDFEPKIALFADHQGLQFYEVIAKNAPHVLRSQGFLAFEVGWTQAAEVAQILERHGFKNLKITKDLGNRERVVSAQRS